MCSAASKRINYSEFEREALSSIAQKHSVIEDKRKLANIENEKIAAWKTITDEYNSKENVNARTTLQLKVSFNLYISEGLTFVKKLKLIYCIRKISAVNLI